MKLLVLKMMANPNGCSSTYMVAEYLGKKDGEIMIKNPIRSFEAFVKEPYKVLVERDGKEVEETRERLVPRIEYHRDDFMTLKGNIIVSPSSFEMARIVEDPKDTMITSYQKTIAQMEEADKKKEAMMNTPPQEVPAQPKSEASH